MEASSTDPERYLEYRRMVLIHQFVYWQSGTELGIKESMKRMKKNKNYKE